jgi:hypothetical protein
MLDALALRKKATSDPHRLAARKRATFNEHCLTLKDSSNQSSFYLSFDINGRPTLEPHQDPICIRPTGAKLRAVFNPLAGPGLLAFSAVQAGFRPTLAFEADSGYRQTFEKNLVLAPLQGLTAFSATLSSFPRTEDETWIWRVPPPTRPGLSPSTSSILALLKSRPPAAVFIVGGPSILSPAHKLALDSGLTAAGLSSINGVVNPTSHGAPVDGNIAMVLSLRLDIAQRVDLDHRRIIDGHLAVNPSRRSITGA